MDLNKILIDEDLSVKPVNIQLPLTGHLYSIMVVDTNNNGLIATGSWDGTVRIWNTNGQQLGIKFFFNEPIEGLKFSPNGKYLAAGTEGSLIVLEMETNEKFSVLPEDPIRGAVFTWSDDSRQLALILFDHSLRIFNIEKRQETGIIHDIASLGGNNIAWCGQFLCMGMLSGAISIYDMQLTAFKEIALLEGHTDSTGAFAFINDKKLLSGSQDGTVRLWNLETKTEEGILLKKDRGITTLTYNPQISIIAAGTDSEIDIFPLNSAKSHFSHRNFKLSSATACNVAIAIHNDESFVIRGMDDHNIGLINIKSGELNSKIMGHYDYINSIVITKDGNSLIYGSNDKKIHIYNLKEQKEVFTLEGHTETVSSIAISPDGNIIASASFDDTINFWSIETKEKIGQVSRNTDLPSSLLFKQDGSGVYAASGGDFTIRAYSLQGQLLFKEGGHEDFIGCPLISTPAIEGFFSAADDGIILFWSKETYKGKPFIKMEGEIKALDLSKDGKYLSAGTTNGTLIIVEIHSSNKIFEKNFDSAISAITFSTDCNWLVIGTHLDIYIIKINPKTQRIMNPIHIYQQIEPVKEIFWLNSQNPDQNQKIINFISISNARGIWHATNVDIQDDKLIKSEVEEIDTRSIDDYENTSEFKITPETEKMATEFKITPEAEGMANHLDELTRISAVQPPNLTSLEIGQKLQESYRKMGIIIENLENYLNQNTEKEHIEFRKIFKRIKILKSVIEDGFKEAEFSTD